MPASQLLASLPSGSLAYVTADDVAAMDQLVHRAVHDLNAASGTETHPPADEIEYLLRQYAVGLPGIAAAAASSESESESDHG